MIMYNRLALDIENVSAILVCASTSIVNVSTIHVGIRIVIKLWVHSVDVDVGGLYFQGDCVLSTAKWPCRRELRRNTTDPRDSTNVARIASKHLPVDSV